MNGASGLPFLKLIMQIAPTFGPNALVARRRCYFDVLRPRLEPGIKRIEVHSPVWADRRHLALIGREIVDGKASCTSLRTALPSRTWPQNNTLDSARISC